MALGGGGFDDFDGDGSDLFADAIAGNDGDARIGTAVAEWDVGHGMEPPGKIQRNYVSTVFGGWRISGRRLNEITCTLQVKCD